VGIVNSAGTRSSDVRCEPNNAHVTTDALSHPWLSQVALTRTDGPARGSAAIIQHGLDRNLSDVSEHPELPNEDEHARVNGDASMLSAAPSSDVMLGVHAPQITSPQRAHPPLERRSKVFARELEAEAEGEAQQAATSAAVSSPQGAAGKRQRESGSPAVDCGHDGWGERW
jgi:hypothetical protein